IVIDDASEFSFRDLNHSLIQKYGFDYIQLQENIGRSAIRNLFAAHARSLMLLFLDCDVMPVADNFILSYITAADGHKMVICGGISYPAQLVSPGNKLHWEYGREREALPALKRNKHPYRSFLTGNFLVHKEI